MIITTESDYSKHTETAITELFMSGRVFVKFSLPPIENNHHPIQWTVVRVWQTVAVTTVCPVNKMQNQS